MRGIDAAHSLLELPDRPTAVFATTDQQAIGVLRACGDRGLVAQKRPTYDSSWQFQDRPKPSQK
jgi:DNA-binding LacI/PurR family transcriptional regulator